MSSIQSGWVPVGSSPRTLEDAFVLVEQEAARLVEHGSRLHIPGGVVTEVSRLLRHLRRWRECFYNRDDPKDTVANFWHIVPALLQDQADDIYSEVEQRLNHLQKALLRLPVVVCLSDAMLRQVETLKFEMLQLEQMQTSAAESRPRPEGQVAAQSPRQDASVIQQEPMVWQYDRRNGSWYYWSEQERCFIYQSGYRVYSDTSNQPAFESEPGVRLSREAGHGYRASARDQQNEMAVREGTHQRPHDISNTRELGHDVALPASSSRHSAPPVSSSRHSAPAETTARKAQKSGAGHANVLPHGAQDGSNRSASSTHGIKKPKSVSNQQRSARETHREATLPRAMETIREAWPSPRDIRPSSHELSPEFLFRITPIQSRRPRAPFPPTKQLESVPISASLPLRASFFRCSLKNGVTIVDVSSLPAKSFQHHRYASIYYAQGRFFATSDNVLLPPESKESEGSTHEESSSAEDSSPEAEELTLEYNWANIGFASANVPGLAGVSDLQYHEGNSVPHLFMQRKDQVWPHDLLPLEYHNPRVLALAPEYGGLVGDLPLLIALLAFVWRPEEVETRLCSLTRFVNLYAEYRHDSSQANRSNGRSEGRGMVVETYFHKGSQSAQDLNDIEDGKFGRIFN
ncbi:hypothetical protein LTR56_019173 [Elasticomyces elasticus]|nr:hypothetical protein LTR22_023690 [Elasticomyces elasticus]KAK3627487.1 hypothetical protein LTR56_019173 [Elasticomyces elasticus]KAK5746715.1 hypothetical protein LTS12_022653 [Elasticomyces elasticus]